MTIKENYNFLEGEEGNNNYLGGLEYFLRGC
jgi:hypothetical protein